MLSLKQFSQTLISARKKTKVICNTSSQSADINYFCVEGNPNAQELPLEMWCGCDQTLQKIIWYDNIIIHLLRIPLGFMPIIKLATKSTVYSIVNVKPFNVIWAFLMFHFLSVFTSMSAQATNVFKANIPLSRSPCSKALCHINNLNNSNKQKKSIHTALKFCLDIFGYFWIASCFLFHI